MSVAKSTAFTAKKQVLVRWLGGKEAKNFLLPLLSLGFFLIVWHIVAELKIWSPVFVPAPSDVWRRYLESTRIHDGTLGISGYTLWHHLWVSLRRILAGSLIATLIGIPTGIIIGLSPVLNAVFSPAITFLRQLPPLAYFSLLIIWFGIDETPKLLLLIIAAFPPIVVSTVAGLNGISADYINAARTLGCGKLSLIYNILIPAALPDIFTGIRLGIGVAYTSVVAAETVNGIPGIGGIIRDAQRYNQTDVVLLGLFVLGISGLVLEFILEKIQRMVTPWRGIV